MGIGGMWRGLLMVLVLAAILIAIPFGCEHSVEKACSCDKWRDLKMQEVLLTLKTYDSAMEGVITKLDCETLEFTSNEFGGAQARLLCDDVAMIVVP